MAKTRGRRLRRFPRRVTRDAMTGGAWTSRGAASRVGGGSARAGWSGLIRTLHSAGVRAWVSIGKLAVGQSEYYLEQAIGSVTRAVAVSSGVEDYYLGGHPVWELFRVAYRMTKRPYLLDGLALGAGYLWALLRRVKRPVSNELMQFHRKEQMQKLRAILKSLITFRRIDNFSVKPDLESSPGA